MKRNTILIIGKVPPPVGGVTIHVKRLLQYIKKEEFESIEYLNLSAFKLRDFKSMLAVKCIHLHSSNPYLRFVISVFGVFFCKKIIVTYHGNLGRFGFVKNVFDYLSILFSLKPILINKQSFLKAKKINKKSVLISAFIPPLEEEPLSSELEDRLTCFVKKYKKVFCTNAYRMSFDKNGDEIYGGTQLVQIFDKLPDFGLVFSDPSGEYVENIGQDVPVNVLFIKEEHSFYEVLKRVDGMIRATTTDGDALSIREALSLKKIVIASDCVDRPLGCMSYQSGNYDELEIIIKNNKYTTLPKLHEVDNVQKVLNVYAKLLINR